MVKEEQVKEKMFASIDAWQQSSLSQKEWCRQQDMAYHIFHYWYRKYKDTHTATSDKSSFVRLEVTPEVQSSCEVIFNDGTKIIFRQSVSAPFLKSLLF